ncbi:MAG: leucyl/phenylalanyl-tRNA--protein transferase [Rickettsiales bacterium]
MDKQNEKPQASISWEFLLAAYANGYFPMAESKNSDSIYWMYPETRGIIQLDKFHTPRSLSKIIKKNLFTITANKAFERVIRHCAETSDKRKDTWINQQIIELYCELYNYGFAHSVECWQKSADEYKKEPILVGGLYGVAIGGAFFGESMFSNVSNASKIALVHLVEILKESGYILLDTQFTNDHLKQFGVIEINRNDYLKQLSEALKIKTGTFFYNISA